MARWSPDTDRIQEAEDILYQVDQPFYYSAITRLNFILGKCAEFSIMLTEGKYENVWNYWSWLRELYRCLKPTIYEHNPVYKNKYDEISIFMKKLRSGNANPQISEYQLDALSDFHDMLIDLMQKLQLYIPVKKKVEERFAVKRAIRGEKFVRNSSDYDTSGDSQGNTA